MRDDGLRIGGAPVNRIDTRDVGEAAAHVLAQPLAHRSAAYTLAGPVEWDGVAQLVSKAAGRAVRYVPASIPAYVAHLARRCLTAAAILVQTAPHVLLRFGQGALEDPALARLLGRPPRGMGDYV